MTEKGKDNKKPVPESSIKREHAGVLSASGLKGKVSLIVGGGLRNPADFAKCLALGADAVYIGTAALIALGCQQFRICHTGRCPTGITTHDPRLEERLDTGEGTERLVNFINTSTREIADFTRITGKNDIRLLDKNDIFSMDRDLSDIAGISWFGIDE